MKACHRWFRGPSETPASVCLRPSPRVLERGKEPGPRAQGASGRRSLGAGFQCARGHALGRRALSLRESVPCADLPPAQSARPGDTPRLSERVLGAPRFPWEEAPGRAALGRPRLLRGPSVARAGGREALGRLQSARHAAPCAPGALRGEVGATAAHATAQVHPPGRPPGSRNVKRGCCRWTRRLPAAWLASQSGGSQQRQLDAQQPRDSVSPAAGAEGRVTRRVVMRSRSVKEGLCARACTCELVRASPLGSWFGSGVRGVRTIPPSRVGSIQTAAAAGSRTRGERRSQPGTGCALGIREANEERCDTHAARPPSAGCAPHAPSVYTGTRLPPPRAHRAPRASALKPEGGRPWWPLLS